MNIGSKKYNNLGLFCIGVNNVIFLVVFELLGDIKFV